MLSNFLHGEQGALMVAGQLVNAVPHMDGKLYAATQTLDEARHVEVFAAYIQKLGQVFPITRGLQELLDAIVAAPDWKFKAVGMQVVTEGLALYFFRDMRNQTQEPLLKRLLTYVSRDEARHTGYGIKYLGHVIPTLSPQENRELQDFAFESTRSLMASRAANTMRDRVMKLWSDAGVDPNDVLAALAAERDVIGRELRAPAGAMARCRASSSRRFGRSASTANAPRDCSSRCGRRRRGARPPSATRARRPPCPTTSKPG